VKRQGLDKSEKSRKTFVICAVCEPIDDFVCTGAACIAFVAATVATTTTITVAAWTAAVTLGAAGVSGSGIFNSIVWSKAYFT
jgi:hypothetical protein